jgi:hypothetical protein
MWAVVGGDVVDIIKFDCQYALNDIPTATATLPVGREVTTGLPSRAHDIAGQVNIQIPTQVYCSVTYGGGATDAVLPVGDYLLFSGWTTGIGYRHTYDGLSMALEITHWLSALTFSSAMSAASSPNNPAHFAFAPVIQDLDKAKGYHPYVNTIAHKYITPQAIQEDLWGLGLQPYLVALAGTDRFNYEAFGAQLKKNDSQGDDCKAALNAFNPGQDPVKLTFDLVAMGLDQQPYLLRDAIVDDVAFGSMTPTAKSEFMKMATTTLWDTLVNMANEYRFAIVPFPGKALVVPYVAGLRTHWDPSNVDFTIMARDLTAYEMNTRLSMPLRAVGVYSGHASRCGQFGATQRMAPGNDTCGGWYIARDDGLVKVEPAPQYMNLIVPSKLSKDSAAVDGQNVKATAVDPDAPAKEPQEDPAKEKQARQKGALDAYAHAIYCTETLRQRSGYVAGPVRFDICPGSTVKIEGTAGDFLAGIDPHGEARFATVYRVRLSMDAQGATASTAFDLSNVRTEDENTKDDTSVDKHPLYTNVWQGDYLLSRLGGEGEGAASRIDTEGEAAQAIADFLTGAT